MGFDFFEDAQLGDARPDQAPEAPETDLLKAPAQWEPGPLGWVKADTSAPLPHNLEAEMAVLGALMFDPDAVWTMPEGFGVECFYEPFHGRLYAAIRKMVDAAMIADPTALHTQFEHDGAFNEFGGRRYLVDLLDHAPPAKMAGQYAGQLIDLASRRQLMEAGSAIFWKALDHDTPARDQVEAAEGQLLGLRSLDQGAQLVDMRTATAQVFAYLEAEESTLGAVRTGIKVLDDQMGPMMPGDLVLGAGRPGMGKSTLEANISLNVAWPESCLIDPALTDRDRLALQQAMPEAGGVLKISGEMRPMETTWRMLAGVAFVMFGKAAPPYSKIRKRDVTPEQVDMLRQAAARVEAIPLIQLKRSGLRVSALRSLARRQKAAWARQGIAMRLLTVDHGGLLHPDTRGLKEYEAQSEIARNMKALSDELGVPILVLLQLNRDVEKRDDKRPMLSDLRSSGQWEENADTVLLNYRPSYYAQKEKEPTGTSPDAQVKWADWDARRRSKDLDIILAKTRHTEGGEVKTWCDIGRHAVLSREPHDAGQFDFGGAL